MLDLRQYLIVFDCDVLLLEPAILSKTASLVKQVIVPKVCCDEFELILIRANQQSNKNANQSFAPKAELADDIVSFSWQQDVKDLRYRQAKARTKESNKSSFAVEHFKQVRSFASINQEEQTMFIGEPKHNSFNKLNSLNPVANGTQRKRLHAYHLYGGSQYDSSSQTNAINSVSAVSKIQSVQAPSQATEAFSLQERAQRAQEILSLLISLKQQNPNNNQNLSEQDKRRSQAQAHVHLSSLNGSINNKIYNAEDAFAYLKGESKAVVLKKIMESLLSQHRCFLVSHEASLQSLPYCWSLAELKLKLR